MMKTTSRKAVKGNDVKGAMMTAAHIPKASLRFCENQQLDGSYCNFPLIDLGPEQGGVVCKVCDLKDKLLTTQAKVDALREALLKIQMLRFASTKIIREALKKNCL